MDMHTDPVTVIEGHWNPPNSAARSKAKLRLHSATFRLEIESGDMRDGSVGELAFSDRVGNIHRHISLPDGSLFITEDNDAVDAMLANSGHGAARMMGIHRLESRAPWIITALVATLLIGGSFILWGVPWLSTYLAASMPPSVNRSLGSGTLESMDGLVLEPSELSLQQQQEIKTRFQRLVSGIGHPDYTFTLHFRQMDEIPNAFALPSGDIVITDALIKLADVPEEVDSVLLHEMGHVIHRHGLQQVIYSTANTVMISMLLGDATAVADLAVALPTFMLNSSYSRKHETEADTFSFEAMLQAGIDPQNFANIMAKMTLDEPQSSDENGGKLERKGGGEHAGVVVGWISSHPASGDRIQRAREYSRRFAQQRVGPQHLNSD